MTREPDILFLPQNPQRSCPRAWCRSADPRALRGTGLAYVIAYGLVPYFHRHHRAYRTIKGGSREPLPNRWLIKHVLGITSVANDRVGSNCDLQHRLALRRECDGEPTFGPERRLCGGGRT